MIKTPLITIQKRHGDFSYIYLSTFDKPKKTQLLAKSEKILQVGFRATSKFKVVLNPTCFFSVVYIKSLSTT